ncbi:MAG TPA: two-component regulator propeller domain-containing protein [Sulfuricaulis sp.]|nr:two-component regulator propeller domain-containing protein [Sulfuricaulis sp.]
MNKQIIGFALALLLTACTGDRPPPKVLDTFEVGPDVFVRSLTVEPAGNALWVGTSTGVLEIDLARRAPRNTFTRAHGLANEYVFAIGLDSRGYKWFGTNAGGVSRYRDGQWRVFFPLHGLADYWIYSFAEQKNGAFWIGTWAGVNKVDLDRLTFTTYVKELINEWVYGIAVDSRDRVWFGTEGGVTMFDNKEWRHWTHADGLGAPNTADLPHSGNTGLGTRSRHDLSTLVGGTESYNPNYVFSMHADQDDRIWAGTWGGGVSRFDGKQWKNFTIADGLAGNIVYSIAQERDGTLWFGTNHGLTRFRGREWKNYGTADGLPGEHVYAITVAPDGDVWVGTRGGVVRLGYEQEKKQ